MLASMVCQVFSHIAYIPLMIGQLFRKEHFFRGSDNNDQLLKIMKVLGSDSCDAYLKAYDIPFETEVAALLHSSVASEVIHMFICSCAAAVTQSSPGHVLLLLKTSSS